MISVSDVKGTFYSRSTFFSNSSNMIIRAPHDTSYRVNFESVWWLVIFQISLPFAAFTTFILITAETIGELLRPERKVLRLLIYALEGPVNLFVGVALICGQYGPMKLPLRFHLAALRLWVGISAFTAVLVVLFLQEEKRFSKTHLPRRKLLQHNRFILTFIFASSEMSAFCYFMIMCRFQPQKPF
jgi:hypothetical protein